MSKFKEILEPIAELLECKNKDYGGSFDQLREKYGPIGFHIRIADKLNRIEQLDSNPAQVKDESIEDTIKDIIGYCTLELNFQRGKENGGEGELITSIVKHIHDARTELMTDNQNSHMRSALDSLQILKGDNS